MSSLSVKIIASFLFAVAICSSLAGCPDNKAAPDTKTGAAASATPAPVAEEVPATEEPTAETPEPEAPEEKAQEQDQGGW
jgi:hypothetical protein